MKRKIHLIIIMLWIVLSANAQDTITVMQYNLLEYGNYNSGFADCYETNNNTQRKDECIRTIMDYVEPDILTVCEFGATQALQNAFILALGVVIGLVAIGEPALVVAVFQQVILHYSERVLGVG